MGDYAAECYVAFQDNQNMLKVVSPLINEAQKMENTILNEFSHFEKYMLDCVERVRNARMDLASSNELAAPKIPERSQTLEGITKSEAENLARNCILESEIIQLKEDLSEKEEIIQRSNFQIEDLRGKITRQEHRIEELIRENDTLKLQLTFKSQNKG